MQQLEKRALTNINKVAKFYDVFKKLTLEKDLKYKDRVYILSCAIIFLKTYEKDKRYTSYFEIAYYIILKYSFKYSDYIPLYDLSTNFGFYPISKYILHHNLIEDFSIEDVLIDINLDKYKNGNYIETLEQSKERVNILTTQNDEQCYIAPTSYGKSSIILEFLKTHNDINKIGIIVPTRSLLIQTYKMLKNQDISKRLIIHDEMYDDEEKFVAVMTQERALRLLKKNNNLFFDLLFIDEAHNLFEKSYRSILLARLIRINKSLNENQKIIYLSPLISNASNLKIFKEQTIAEQKIHFNIKEPDIFEYRLDDNVYKYNRFVNEFYFISQYKNQLEYIKENLQSKNFFYIRSPKKIEMFAKTLSKKSNIEDELLEELSNILNENIHENFYGVEYVKKGIVYIHGKLPDLIKEYLEYKFKQIDNLKFIIANTVILEGINFPIDTIFILNTHSLQAKELTNLIGRANRLNQIFLNKNSLNKLVPKIHFINSNEYNRQNSNISNKIQLLRSRIFDDKIQNPILESFDIDKLKQEEQLIPLKIKSEEEFIIKEPDNEFDKIKKYMIEAGIYNYYNQGKLIIEHILKTIEKIEQNQEKWKSFDMLDKIFILFLQNQEHNILDYDFKRLMYEEARNYYEMHIKDSHQYTLKKNINKIYEYFLERGKSDDGYEFYIGSTYGEISKSTEPYPNSNNEVYIDLRTKNKKELINLAIVKLKMEDDFISFKLNKFITMLYDFELISENEYNLYIYGTKNIEKSKLRKIGLSSNLISKLEADNQIDNILIDENNIVTTTKEFEEYKQSVNDFYRFEIDKFL
ncbi:MAG: DEAD/DEAH box helicase [Sulfurovum sp.]|nr:DEAD/DEAH box helicase [Sulfurovum sp.]